MRLYLVRHGEAVPEEIDGHRPLSEKGRRDVQRMAVILARAGVKVDRVVHSGKRRALETALALARTVGPGNLAEEGESLMPRDAVDRLCEAVEGWEADTMVVGHLPHLAKTAGRLLAGDEEAEILAFTPGSVACLERDDTASGWMLAWFLRPELFG
jgi:phosphohistidine phosphatase